MLQRNFAFALQGLSNKTLEESGIFKKEKFTENDWQHWRNKTVIEFWEHRYNKAWISLRKAIDMTNEKRHKQENFVQKNKGWSFIESLLRIMQIGLIIVTLILYIRMIKPQVEKSAQQSPAGDSLKAAPEE